MPKPVDWLNYQHLLYFWMVARYGTVAEASKRLHLTSPTVSQQIRKLEQSTGRQLLRPKGRTLELTDAGQVVMRYADQIFGLGTEMAEALAGQFPEGKLLLAIGIVDAVPKLVVHRLLGPILEMTPRVQLHCSEGTLERLMEKLVAHHLDVIISDAKFPHEPLRASIITCWANRPPVFLRPRRSFRRLINVHLASYFPRLRSCCPPEARRCGVNSIDTSICTISGPRSPTNLTTPR